MSRNRLMQEAEIAQARHVAGDQLTEVFLNRVDLRTGTGIIEVLGPAPEGMPEEYVNYYEDTLDDDQVLAHLLDGRAF